MPVRIALVDDHQILRDGLKLRLQHEADFAVVDEAHSAEEAIRRFDKSMPDLVVMDYELGGQDGIAATKELRRRWPNVKVLILTGSKRPLPAHDVILAGASGFLRKEDASQELVKAIRLVAEGKTYLSVDAATALAESLRTAAEGSDEPALTDRERDVLKLMADGLSYKEIASDLEVSIKSVETYRARLVKKLGLKTRAELVRYAVRKGLVSA